MPAIGGRRDSRAGIRGMPGVRKTGLGGPIPEPATFNAASIKYASGSEFTITGDNGTYRVLIYGVFMTDWEKQAMELEE